MHIYLKKVFLPALCLSGILMSFLFREIEKTDSNEMQNYLGMRQNRPNFGLENPLKGISTIIYFAMIPASNKPQSDKINLIVEKELKKFGKVNLLSLISKTENGKEVIDFNGLKGGITLIYEIQELFSLSGQSLGVVRASLNLETSVEILKTKERTSSYVFSNNCFLKGTLDENLEKFVSESLEYLMLDFFKNFRAVNTEKPTFNLYSH